ncbi:MAG TPA: restriction endonuclease [Verrucomicrobiae bacterium]|nr:restriction endonuclease [Verrucomicrobiae bacterium]
MVNYSPNPYHSPTRDGGGDILAHFKTGMQKMLCLIEAKKYRPDRPVGIQLVRQLYGTCIDELANSAMLVTTSHFSPDAKKFEEKHNYHLSLKDYADVVGWLLKYGRWQSRRKNPPSTLLKSVTAF